MVRQRRLLIVSLGAVVLIVSGWVVGTYRGSGSVVDGWGIGAPYACTDLDPERPCSALIPFAGQVFDRRDPGHVPVVWAQLHEEEPIVSRTSPLFIAVFQLADGSIRAIGVGYPGIATEPMALDSGP